MLVLATFVGIIGGLGAVVFRIMINASHLILVKIPRDFTTNEMVNNIITVLAPTVGGLIVGSLIYYIAREAKGHGVPEIIFAVNKEGGKMRYRVPFVKIIASAITIGSGGSAGREGPIAQIGGGFASLLAHKMRLSEDDSKTLVIAGVSAGIAATFNAPLGGTLFGLEVIRRDRKAFSVLPLLISSVVGTTIGEIFLGVNPSFIFPNYLSFLDIRNVPIFILIGLLMGLFAVFWTKSFYFIEDLLEKFPTSPIILAGLGGLGVGLIELWIPEVTGITYVPIDDAFALKLTIQTVILFSMAKLLATSLSIGSGGSGGVFAPTLFQGVMLGSAFGLLIVQIGYTGVPIEIFALLGMAALFAGSARAPLTAIIMTSEMVNDFQLIIPLMFAVVSSWLVSKIFLPEDIYTLKLSRRGVKFAPSIDFLEEIVVEDIMIKDPITVSPKDRIEHLLELMKTTGHTGYPVVEEGVLVGIITEHDVLKALEQVDMKEWIVFEVCTKDVVTVGPECPLSILFMKMVEKEINRFPVLEHDDSAKLIGWVTRSDIMKVYRREKSLYRTQELETNLFDEVHDGKLVRGTKLD